MGYLTDFADQAVVLPVVAAVALVLVLTGWRRGALIWLGVIAFTFGVVLALKLGFFACGPVFLPWALRSPSGHTAAAAVVAGGIVTVLGGRWMSALAVSMVAAAAIGLSRVELGVHSLPEVMIGATVGILGAVALAHIAGAPPVTRPLLLLAVAITVAALVHGTRMPAEEVIWRFAHGLLDFIPACRDHAAAGRV